MSQLAAFFDGAEVEYGFLYPDRYMVALFRSLPDAESARSKLTEIGLTHSIAVGAADILAFAREHQLDAGIWRFVVTQLSRAIGTEAVYADRDVEMARRGAALLAVRCDTREAKEAAWRCLQAQQPAAARYYSQGYIEHLAGET